MINEPQETAYGYLLDPCFQLVNTNGKPLTNGYIECYVHGSRIKYYCYSDFDGTKHPFQIPIDSLGTNIVLADVGVPLDVYVYNRFGNLEMSRYNVVAGSGVSGGGGGTPADPIDAQYWLGNDGETVSVNGGSAGRDLPLPASPDSNEGFVKYIQSNHIVVSEGIYLVHAVVDFRQDEQDLENTIENLKITTGLSDTEDVVFERDEAGHDASDNIHSLKISFIRHAVEGTTDDICIHVISPVDLQLANIRKLSIVKLQTSGYGVDIGSVITEDDLTLDSHGNVTEIADHPIAGGSGSTYYPGQYIDITDNTISVSGIYPDTYLTSASLNGYVKQEDLGPYATEQWVLDKNYITSADIPDIPDDVVTSAELAQTSGAIEQDISDLTSAMTDALADKMDKTSSADFYPRYDNPEGYLTSVPSEYVTETEMSGYVQDHTSAFLTSADLPDVSDMATQTWVTEQHYITSADIPPLPDDLVTSAELATVSGEIVNQIPSLDGYATETWVGQQGYLTSIPSEYVTDTELSATSAAIQNEIPGVRDLVAGNGINITSTNSDVTISVDGSVVTSSELSTVSADIVSQIPSLQGYATEGYVQDYTSAFITSADIPKEVPDPDVYQFLTSDGTSAMVWRNLRTVNNKLKEGQYIHLEERAFYEGYKETTISVSGLQPEGNYLTSGDLNGYATEAWVQSQDYITSADVPPQVQSDWSEVDSAAIDYIKNKPEMSELSAISPLYINDTQNGSEIGIDASAFPDTSDMATQTWCSSSFFPIDGLQVVNSSAEASGANIVYLIPISNS